MAPDRAAWVRTARSTIRAGSRAGLDGPPRNPLGGGPDQDSGRGEPEGSPGTEGQSMMPESPTEDDDRV